MTRIRPRRDRQMACRDCHRAADGEGVCYVPSAEQWFRWEDLSGRRTPSSDALLYYCAACYVQNQLEKNARCLHCGVFFQAQSNWKTGSSGSVWAASPMVDGRFFDLRSDADPEQYRLLFADPRSAHLTRDGKLCGPCVQRLVEDGRLLKIVGPIRWNSCALCGGRENVIHRFVDPSTFESALNGSFTVSPSLREPLTFPCDVCRDCLEGRHFERTLTVECGLCGAKFQLALGREHPDSGWGCNALLAESGVQCGYGSKHDDATYAWQTVMPDEYRGKRVACDSCFDGMLAKPGLLRLVRRCS